jgi:multidrug/hemolysin transport system permease protein
MRGAIMSMTTRNLKLFFRDKASVFFSLLSVVIIILLYAVFLGDVQVKGIEAAAGRAVVGAKWLVNAWILAGILAITTVTVSLGAYGTMVNDVMTGQVKDFFAAPVRRAEITAGYMVSAGLVSLIMSLVALVISEGYIVLSGGSLLSPLDLLQTFAVLAVSIFSYSSLVCFIASFIKSARAFGALSTIVGTMIGFLTGIYMPMGILPAFLNTVMKFLPFTYSAVWLRQIFTRAPMDQVFAGAQPEAARNYADFYGINLTIGTTPVEPWLMVVIIAGSGILFFALSVWRLSRKSWISK